ncbi:MAG: pyridoxal-phosphate dependent enzyme [Flavobacteriales bacterium]|nr:pyridoxal-phosphate dependent enzyme [Flavobacteriales bacterium]MDG1175241.1 pyridoxal-phosphate dependent enzyme [Flavobacteriales bacterium]
MNYYNNILETIGNTPMVKLNVLTTEIDALVLAKVETTNPGNSTKDRMAVKMIEDAEADGRLKPGGTVIEGTSGNTGMGLALACIIKGYKMVCVLSDKQSKEKMDILRAVGAEVVVCPTNVDSDDPRSYYSVSKRLAKETPNSWYVNQYDNLSNRLAHYESTGPEIWEQTDGKITHFVVGVGTGGTISGVGKYLKEKNPNVKILGIDTYGSVFKKYHETGIFDEAEIYPYVTEGIGEDILPKNVNFDIIDHFEKVTDKAGAIMTPRIAKEEGIFVGNSAGSAIQGILQMKHMFKKGDVVVVLFHDHGSRYVGKFFNQEWMKERGYVENIETPTAKDIISKEGHLVIVNNDETFSSVIEKMSKFNISQFPVFKGKEMIGSISETSVFNYLYKNPEAKRDSVELVMNAPFPVVDLNTKMEEISKLITKDNAAVMVKQEDGSFHIITKQDIIKAIS